MVSYLTITRRTKVEKAHGKKEFTFIDGSTLTI